MDGMNELADLDEIERLAKSIKADSWEELEACLPCGHTRKQGTWLGCTEDECRTTDGRTKHRKE